MSRLRNGSTLTGAVLITSLGLFSAVANAQNVEPVPPDCRAADAAGTDCDNRTREGR